MRRRGHLSTVRYETMKTITILMTLFAATVSITRAMPVPRKSFIAPAPASHRVLPTMAAAAAVAGVVAAEPTFIRRSRYGMKPASTVDMPYKISGNYVIPTTVAEAEAVEEKDLVDGIVEQRVEDVVEDVVEDGDDVVNDIADDVKDLATQFAHPHVKRAEQAGTDGIIDDFRKKYEGGKEDLHSVIMAGDDYAGDVPDHAKDLTTQFANSHVKRAEQVAGDGIGDDLKEKYQDGKEELHTVFEDGHDYFHDVLDDTKNLTTKITDMKRAEPAALDDAVEDVVDNVVEDVAEDKAAGEDVVKDVVDDVANGLVEDGGVDDAVDDAKDLTTQFTDPHMKRVEPAAVDDVVGDVVAEIVEDVAEDKKAGEDVVGDVVGDVLDDVVDDKDDVEDDAKDLGTQFLDPHAKRADEAEKQTAQLAKDDAADPPRGA
ncbi:hypothetical protein LTR66_000520 [Elasticomyces elasticus]|nr:hypothetical protein LTR66_000520 [Elasticomyces elasticus]